VARPSRLRPRGHGPELERPPGKKTLARLETDSLARGLGDFSGSITRDERYGSPFCVLSLVDHRIFTRLTYRVLEKGPTQDDIRAFLPDFQAHLDARGLKVLGLTTDSSNLSPVPLAEVFPNVPHQVCRSTGSRRSPRRCGTPWPRGARR
jgi:hypothetical protein